MGSGPGGMRPRRNPEPLHMTTTPLTHDQGSRPGYLQARDTTGLGPKRLRYSHDAMIDIIVMNPAVTQAELAETFGYTQAWVSVVMASDAFRERLEFRRGELVDPAIGATLRERFQALAQKSLDVVLAKLSKPIDAIDDATALKAMELGAKALSVGGFGKAPEAAAAPVRGMDNLNALSDRLTGLLRRANMETSNVQDAQIIDAGTGEILPAAGHEAHAGGPQAGTV